MREFVKVRMVAGSLVVSLPQSVLEPVGLKEGDRVILEAAPPRRLIITKEGESVTSTQYLELEIDLLNKKKTAIESDLRYKERQYSSNMPFDNGLSGKDSAMLIMSGLTRDRDQLDVELAEKRIQLYDIQGDAYSQRVMAKGAESSKAAISAQFELPHISASKLREESTNIANRPGIPRIRELLKEAGADSRSTAAKRKWLDSQLINKIDGVTTHEAVSFALIELKKKKIIDYDGKPIQSVWLT